jgi:hypothetical protein
VRDFALVLVLCAVLATGLSLSGLEALRTSLLILVYPLAMLGAWMGFGWWAAR